MKRVVNQDNFRIKEYSPDVVLAVVCDGMGGAKGGGVASSLAISAFIERIDADADIIVSRHSDDDSDENISNILLSAVERANEAVFESAASSSELSGMGTTLVCALVTPKRIYSVNVGDSRMYISAGDTITQITKDHSYVQYLVDIGRITPTKAKSSHHRNIITRAVGTESSVEADLFTVQHTSEPSHIILCSDGLTNFVEPTDINSQLKGIDITDGEALKNTADGLVALANERGGSDNITVVLLSV